MSPPAPSHVVVALLALGGCGWFGSEDPARTDDAQPTPTVTTPTAPLTATDAPDVVIITLDTTRADHLGLYGYFRDTSPTLDAIAARGVVFDRLTVPMATTLPTHLSLMTGVWPHEHGVLANVQHGGQRFLPSPGLTPLAQVLTDQGYRTGAFTSAAPLNADTGIERGFLDFYPPSRAERTGDVTTDLALAWLAAVPADAPMLLWVHYYDPHNPWSAPDEYRARFTGDDAKVEAWLSDRKISKQTKRPTGEVVRARPAHNGYDAEIRFMDDQLARLWAGLEARGRLDRSLVVIMGDHGEGLNQHAEPGHGLVWAEQLHAPLVLLAPGVAPGRVSMPVSAADVLPTALARVDVPGEATLTAQASGIDVLAPGALARPVLSQTSARQLQFGVSMTYALTDAARKCVWTDDTRTLWDLAADPFELTPLHDEPALTDCVTAGRALVDAQRARGTALGSGRTAPMNDAQREALRQLGYVDEGTDE